jgi:hypothetical protein
MLRATALLIVMLLSGHAGLSLACELWCHTPAADAHHSAIGCHKAPDPGALGTQVIAAAADCHDAPAVTAFLNEGRQPDARSVTMVAAGHGTPAVSVHHNLIDEGWSVFNGQPARPPAFRTILRI